MKKGQDNNRAGQIYFFLQRERERPTHSDHTLQQQQSAAPFRVAGVTIIIDASTTACKYISLY